ncbi:hypothetical protein QQ045_023624 [Rhodiola kirilowii]
MSKTKVVMLIFVFLAVAVATDRTCEDVEIEKSLIQCIPYLRGGATSPTEACCEGVKNLKHIAPTKTDRQKACQCLKDAAARVPVKPKSATELPEKCGVETEIRISPQVDCKRLFRQISFRIFVTLICILIKFMCGAAFRFYIQEDIWD